MNENQMNTQNMMNNQSVNPNTGVPVQPVPQSVGVGPVQPVDTRIGTPVQPIPQNMGVGTEQSVDTGVGAPVPSVQTTNNFMDDFAQAVVPQSEPVVAPSPIPTMQAPLSEPIPVTNVAPEPEVVHTPVETTSVVEPEAQPAVAETQTTNIPEAQSVIEEAKKVGKKKKGNWAFILALFAIVGFFVLLLPLLVKVFGY